MDPNTCFNRILTALQEQDADEYVSAFQDLSDWLAKGGFPPVVNTLGDASYNIGAPGLPKYERRPRRVLTDRPFIDAGETHSIRTTDPNADGRFEFVTWRGDDIVARYPLPIE